MSEESAAKKRRRADAVRLVIASRERAPRSPRMGRALKRLIWRYTTPAQDRQGSEDVQE